MAQIDRRLFLETAGSMAGFIALSRAAWGGGACFSMSGSAGRGYGALRVAGPELALPEGFEYLALGVEGDPMSDGHPTPRAHDGMAAFALRNGNIRLIRNHEVTEAPPAARPIGGEDRAYDPRAGGGTTSLEIHRVTRRIVRDFVSLNGTIVNCAGGPTPWGSWLSCEESVLGEGEGYAKPHGYVFEVPAHSERPVEPEPIRGMGRFVHEAVAVDPATGIIYLTEDMPGGSGFYRFLPDDPYRRGHDPDLAAGGRLQMLAAHGRPQYDTARGQEAGTPLAASWVDIDDPDPADAEERPSAVFFEGLEKGGATFARLEGCWFGDDSVYFDATEGGELEIGQIWRYRPRENDLTLLYESRDPAVLKRPDNICVTPQGAILVCEDPVSDAYVRGLTKDGHVFDFARNILNEREFAGATFGPDGKTLFVNIQGDRSGTAQERGMTFAIWGPWERGSL